MNDEKQPSTPPEVSRSPSPSRESPLRTSPESATDAVVDAQLDTLAALLRQPLESAWYGSEPECDAAIQAVCRLAEALPPEGVPGDATPSQESYPSELGQYRLLEKLGQGGMGTVYRALHTRLEKLVAVKILRASRVADAEAVARFTREMKAVGRLHHPNIVGAFDAGEIDGSHYLVMELVDGQDLGTIVRRAGPLPVADACEAVRQAALGLDHAHGHGLVHRDVKPSNLIVTRQGEVKILDLGLARLGEQVPGGAELTNSGQMMGTFEYMAPEQGSDSHTVDHRADVYALGATLYKLLTGRTPFSAERYDTLAKRLVALATEDPEPIRRVQPDVPKNLARLVHRMLARDPDKRMATAREAAELLGSFAVGADLAGLVRRAEEAVPEPPAEPGTSGTQPAASSAMEHTPHTVQPSPSAAFRPRAGRWRRLLARLGSLPPIARIGLAVAGAAAAVLLGIFLTLQTPQGELVIESDDPSVEVVVKQDGATVDIVSADGGWRVALRDGKYDVELAGGADRMQLSDNQVTLTRGERTLLRVTRKRDTDVPALAAASVAPSAAPYVDRGWVRLVNRMSDRCIGVKDGSTEPRESLRQYDPVPGALEQHWRIESSDQPGLYRLKNRKSGLYVTLKQPRQGEGYLQRPLEDDNNEFLFSILDIDGKWFRIVSHVSKLDAAIWGSSMREGEWLVQWPFSAGATDKLWRIEPVDDTVEHGWIDVLAQVDPQLHGVFGAWRRDGSRLVCDPLDFTRIGSPVYATGDYETEARFRWIGKVGEVNLLLPVGDSAVHVWVKPGAGGIGQFSGAEPARAAGTWTYNADRRFTLSAIVRVDGATATVETRMDDEPYATWTGPLESLYPRSDWMIPNRTVGFGAHVCSVSLEGLRVRPLAGGQLVRKTYRAEPAGVEPGQAVELAALVDPARHAVLGKWEVADGTIACVEPREFARVAIPLVPHGDYELSGTLLRPKGLIPATLAIPVGGRYTGLEIKDKAVLLERVGASPPWKRADVQTGPETQFVVRVEHQGETAKINVTIDGKPVLEWEGPAVAAQRRFDWTLTTPSLGLGAHGGQVVVKDLTLKLLSGTAERIVENVEPIPDSQSAVGQPGSPFPADGTAEEQQAWVVAELRRLNPEFNGRAKFIVEDNHIIALDMARASVAEISPLAMLSDLQTLSCLDTQVGDLLPLKHLRLQSLNVAGTKVADLAPLRGMPLKSLRINGTRVTTLKHLAGMPLEDLCLQHCGISDLSPLKGMPLRRLEAHYTQVSDLSPLAGAPVERLDVGFTLVANLAPLRDAPVKWLGCHGTKNLKDLSPLAGMALESLDVGYSGVTDLTALRGMQLRFLSCWGSKVTDLSPIAGMPLEEVRVNLDLTRDGAILGGIPTLKKINYKPVVEVLQGAVSVGLPAQPFPGDGTVEEQKAWVVAELRRLNPEFDGQIDAGVDDGKIVKVTISRQPVENIAPLSSLEHLHTCNLTFTKVRDLEPLRGLPIRSMDLNGSPIRDLSALADCPIEILQVTSSEVGDDQIAVLAKTSIRELGITGTRISSLQPLAGLKLETLHYCNTRSVKNLEPLAGMPLRELAIHRTPVADLSPLAGMPLEVLEIEGTAIDDLSPLVGAPLTQLHIDGTKVKDLRPLPYMPLEKLRVDIKSVADCELLRQIETLKDINGKPAADLLREVEEKLEQSETGEPAPVPAGEGADAPPAPVEVVAEPD